jgi:hypothetical protein
MSGQAVRRFARTFQGLCKSAIAKTRQTGENKAASSGWRLKSDEKVKKIC